MAWSTPMTATSGSAFTAAQWNTYIRDNLLATGPALATTTASQWFVSSSSSSIVARQFKSDYVATEQTTTSNSFTDLSTSGPSVTLTTGSKVIVMIQARMGNDTTNSSTQMSYSISGATSVSPDVKWGCVSDGLQGSSTNDNIRTVASANLHSVNAGTNTFTMKYLAVSNTARFKHRSIIVWSF